jgi:hypothetical protein
MSTTATRGQNATTDPHAGKVDMKLEVITVSVADFDRAKGVLRGSRVPCSSGILGNVTKVKAVGGIHD